MRTEVCFAGAKNMNCAAVSVEFENVEVPRGPRAPCSTPVSGHFGPGVLNILTGANGSGKSTLLDVVALRARRSTLARITWAGCTDATDIAYLPQQLWDVLDIRVRDLLALAFRRCDRDLKDAPPALKEALAEPRKELGALSGGQRQLLLFWLVASQSKRVYIYDEPLRHLDTVATRYVVGMIERQVQSGLLIVVSEHSSENHWSVPCDRVILSTNRAKDKEHCHVE
jgi:ABC-2 type transport system ATP-binding protein